MQINKEDLLSFCETFRDYYDLKLRININTTGLYNKDIPFTCTIQIIPEKDEHDFDISKHIDSLVGFVSCLDSEYGIDMIKAFSYNRKGESVVTYFSNIKAFSNTRFQERISNIQLVIK